MSLPEFPSMKLELERLVRARTGNRLRDLEILFSPDGITLRGRAPTFHVKQLAQHGIREKVPQARLLNAIIVT